MAARICHVREHTRGTEKDVVLDRGAGVDRDIVLDLDVGADTHAGGDKHILAQVAILTKLGVVADMGKMPDFRARTDVGLGINDRRGMSCVKNSGWRLGGRD